MAFPGALYAHRGPSCKFQDLFRIELWDALIVELYDEQRRNYERVQIITFQLDGIDEEAYSGVCDEMTPAFASVPGLQAKLWLADRDANTYGGVYVFSDADAQETFAESDLFAAVASNPNLAGVTSRTFDVLPGPTAVTGGGRLAAERAPA